VDPKDFQTLMDLALLLITEDTPAAVKALEKLTRLRLPGFRQGLQDQRENPHYAELPFADASFEVAMAVHSLHFAADPVAVLAEWLRVTAPGGRLSISVPGPRAATYLPGFDRAYRRYGVRRRAQIPTRTALARWARAAGWRRVATDADPSTVIRLADADAFGRWMRTGSRSTATAGWSEERLLAFEAELRAASPRADDGTFEIPFGSLYLTARR